jgi:hypothetical protein
MHGNEPSGFYAVHKLLQRLHKADFLQKKVYFIFLNMRAALYEPIFSKRHCDDEADMNRIWERPGKNQGQNSIVKHVKEFILKEEPEMILDFHNTTGNNPLFAIATGREKETLKFCSFFSDVIFCDIGKDTLIDWAKQHCMSITVECGRNNDPESHARADDVLKRALILGGAVEGDLEPHENIHLLHSPELVDVFTDDISFSETNTGKDLVLRPDLDRMNTIEIPKGTFIGWENKQGSIKSSVLDINDNTITTNQDCTFSMMTTVVDVIRKDTLGYVVKTEQGSIAELTKADKF